jgi:hypothetical protein
MTDLRPQHMQALTKATEIRLYRAALKREVRSYAGENAQEVGRGKLAAVLLFPPDERVSLASLRVVEFLTWGRRLTYPVAVRYAAACGLSEWATLEQTTDRQRLQLVDLLNGGIDEVRRAEIDNEIARWAVDRNRRAA